MRIATSELLISKHKILVSKEARIFEAKTSNITAIKREGMHVHSQFATLIGLEVDLGWSEIIIYVSADHPSRRRHLRRLGIELAGEIKPNRMRSNSPLALTFLFRWLKTVARASAKPFPAAGVGVALLLDEAPGMTAALRSRRSWLETFFNRPL